MRGMRVLFFVALLLGLTTGTVRAEIIDLVNCSDVNGRLIRGKLDPSLNTIVASGFDGEQRVIRYNPELMPKLSVLARQFFFAQAFARLALGDVPGSELTPERAHQADCVGVTILEASGLLRQQAMLQTLEAELVFSDEQWAQLPGPRREFNLTACPRKSAIRLPLATPPTAKKVELNACIRNCGDRLFACKDDCLGSFERCVAACKAN
ncbi:MAG: hypothetical protein WBV56_13495 [Azonexus sp.]